MIRDTLQDFATARQALIKDRTEIADRIAAIEQALTMVALLPLPSASKGTGQSMREHVLAVLQAGPKTKHEVLAEVQARGYRFSTWNPLNSLGVILYGKGDGIVRNDGMFSLAQSAGTTVASTAKKPKKGSAISKTAAAHGGKRWVT